MMTLSSTARSDIQPDVRKRSDELERDFLATEGGDKSILAATSSNTSSATPVANDAVRNSSARVKVDGNLLTLLEKSAQTFRHTAENVENRGLKLLLKVVAQERVVMYNTLREAVGKGQVDPLDPDRESAARGVQQGLQDIQTSMTVQRQGRENVALTNLLKEEETLLAAYETAQAANEPYLQELLESQRANIAKLFVRLQSVSDGVEPIVARVFDTRVEGESAIMRLRERGLDSTQIDAAPISQVAKPVLRTTKTPATAKNTMVAGAISGGIVGGIVGLALATFVWLYPQLEGWVTVGPWALLIGAILIGAGFGTVFGFFIGQNQREDDLMVTADGLVNGEILVVAYPQAHQVPMVEEILQVHHARELNR